MNHLCTFTTPVGRPSSPSSDFAYTSVSEKVPPSVRRHVSSHFQHPTLRPLELPANVGVSRRQKVPSAVSGPLGPCLAPTDFVSGARTWAVVTRRPLLEREREGTPTGRDKVRNGTTLPCRRLTGDAYGRHRGVRHDRRSVLATRVVTTGGY